MALPTPRTDGAGDDNRKQSARRTIHDLITDDKMQPVFRALLPKHFTPERMIRLAMMAVTRTPKLAECHPMMLLGAFVESAALGLEPNSPLDHLHLLPFWNSNLNAYEITRIIGYRGYIELGRRTGEQVSIHADVAYKNDLFEVSYGTDCHIKHIPLFGESDRGNPIAAYCHVVLKDGQAFLAMPWSEVLKAKSRSPSVKRGRSSPWDTDLERMARKTPIRRLYGGGEVPMSIEMAQAIALDERSMDYQQLAIAARDSVDEVREALTGFARPEEDEESGNGGQTESKPQQQSQGRPTEVSTESAEAKPPYVVGGRAFKQAKAAANAAIAMIDEAEDSQALTQLRDEIAGLGRMLIEDGRQDQADRVRDAFNDQVVELGSGDSEQAGGTSEEAGDRPAGSEQSKNQPSFEGLIRE